MENNREPKLKTRADIGIKGYFGKDPVTHTFPSGAKYVQFSLSTTRSYKDASGQWVNQTSWWPCKAFGETMVRILDECSKGSWIDCKGEVTFTESKRSDGTRSTYLNVTIWEINEIVGRNGGIKASSVADIPNVNTVDEDVPF